MASKTKLTPGNVIWYEYLHRFSSAPPVGLRAFDEHYELACVIPTGPKTRPTDLLVDLLKPSVIDTLEARRPLRYFDVINVCTSCTTAFDRSAPVWIQSLMAVDMAFCKLHGAGRTIYARRDEPDYALIEIPNSFASFRQS